MLFFALLIAVAGIPIGMLLARHRDGQRPLFILQASMMLSFTASYCLFVAGPWGIVCAVPVILWASNSIWRNTREPSP